MAGRLQSEIQQSKPFECLEVEAAVTLAHTSDALFRGIEERLKAAGLSLTQYNVLRILRGASPQGLACGDVGARMITRDPDITRLLDRMEQRGLVERARETCDRRVVKTRIRPAGLRLLKTLDRPLVNLQRKRLGHLGARRLKLLIALLDAAREVFQEKSASKRPPQASKGHQALRPRKAEDAVVVRSRAQTSRSRK
jgi:DNA-binding MarR family transcriptional regulator